jgi:hypothetical protein
VTCPEVGRTSYCHPDVLPAYLQTRQVQVQLPLAHQFALQSLVCVVHADTVGCAAQQHTLFIEIDNTIRHIMHSAQQRPCAAACGSRLVDGARHPSVHLRQPSQPHECRQLRGHKSCSKSSSRHGTMVGSSSAYCCMWTFQVQHRGCLQCSFRKLGVPSCAGHLHLRQTCVIRSQAGICRGGGAPFHNPTICPLRAGGVHAGSRGRAGVSVITAGCERQCGAGGQGPGGESSISTADKASTDRNAGQACLADALR